MREIEFRAKSKFDKDNKWVYGDLIQGENSYISTKEEFYSAVVGLGGHLSTFVELVDKKTIGQYTGLKDKNGTKIFEGDIAKDEFGRIMKVIFKNNWCKFQFELINITGDKWTNNFRYADLTDWFNESVDLKPEVIGNIYDNPELLEKVEG